MSAQTRLNSGLQMDTAAAALLVVDRASGQANPPVPFPDSPSVWLQTQHVGQGLGLSSHPLVRVGRGKPNTFGSVRSCGPVHIGRKPAGGARLHPLVLSESSPRTSLSKAVSPTRVPVVESPAILSRWTCRRSTGASRAFRAVRHYGKNQVLHHGDRPGCQCRRDGQRGSEVGRGGGQSCGQFPAGASGGGSVRVADFGGRAGLAGHDVSRSLSPTVRLSALVRLTARVVRGLDRASLPPTPALPSGKAPVVRTAP